jgi:hypothetical protein
LWRCSLIQGVAYEFVNNIRDVRAKIGSDLLAPE